MNINALALFQAVAEEGSVTRGAERAAISQPAVSRAVAELERALGERLLDRGPKGVVTTEAGKTLLTYAQRIFALEKEAEEALADLKGLDSGRLSIGASTTIGDYLLPPVIARFLEEHPAVDLSMEVSNTETIGRGVLEGCYDIGFTEGRIEISRFEVQAFSDDELVVFAAPSHPFANGARLDDLEKQRFVLREKGSGTRAVVEAGMRSAGFEPRISTSLGSTTAIKSAVAAGLGLGVASRLAVADGVARGDLVVVPTPLALSRQLHSIRLPWRRESAALRSFMTYLRG